MPSCLAGSFSAGEAGEFRFFDTPTQGILTQLKMDSRRRFQHTPRQFFEA
ncbi:hypothetical protein CYA_0186 [Synechococcus sp. JA-3-3Ab]|nr:hypothetical protein CYA_0186 [Synechococcus sp. JA-3-3Ab]